MARARKPVAVSNDVPVSDGDTPISGHNVAEAGAVIAEPQIEPPNPASMTPEPDHPGPEAQPQPEPAVVESQIIPPSKPAGTSRWPLVLAVLGGGVLALGGAFVENFIQGQSTAGAPSDLLALTQRVSQIEAKLAAPASSAAPAGSFDPSALEQRLNALEAASKTSGSPQAVSAPPTQGDTGALEARLKSIETALAAPKGDQRSVQARESAPPSQQNGPAIAIVAQSLMLALDHGTPFETELAALESLGTAPERLTPLKPFAAKGLVTPASLASQLHTLGPSLVKAAEPKSNLGLADRLLASAGSLVRISMAADSKGDTPTALVSRAEAALAQGDVAGAQTLMQKLPEDLKVTAGGFEAMLKEHLEAKATGRALLNEALSALARPKP